MIEIFKIDFLKFTLIDIIDIILVAYLCYMLFRTIKGTIASQIFIGLLLIILFSFVAKALNMQAASFILKLLTDIWVIAFVILFQPELRRLLISMSQSKFFRLFVKNEFNYITEEIVNAVKELSEKQFGALIVLSRTTGLKGVTETGVSLMAKVTKQLIVSIFFPRSPLHDGAVVIKSGMIESARCTLPLSSKTILNGFQLGMRHKAALGISELSDAFVIIVSEETGTISIAENGILLKGLNINLLREKLLKIYSNKNTKNWKNIFKNIKNDEKLID